MVGKRSGFNVQKYTKERENSSVEGTLQLCLSPPSNLQGSPIASVWHLTATKVLLQFLGRVVHLILNKMV